MDEIDIAQELTERYIADCLRKVGSPLTIAPDEGVCMNCDASLASDRRRFCDSQCAEDWRHRRDVRRKQGRQP